MTQILMSSSYEVSTMTAKQAMDRANEAFDAGNMVLASSWFKKAVELEPEAPSLWVLYADCELRQGREESAEEAMRRAQRLAPKQSRILRAIGRMWLEIGKLELAEEAILRSIKIEPTAAAYIYLSITLSRRERGREAEKALQKALELEPDNEEAHYNLGVLYRENQQFDLAEQHLRRAVGIDSNYLVALSELNHLLGR